MSNPMNVVAAGTTSTLDQVKNGFVNTASWMYRQVEWLVSSAKSGAVKIVEAVKPFFASALKFISDQAGKARDFIVANKEHASYAFGAVAIVAVGAAIIYFFVANSNVKSKDANSTTQTVNQAQTEANKVDATKTEDKKITETAKK